MASIPLTVKKDDYILILAPHPDDEAIGMGGMLALYAPQCDVIVMTDGSRGSKSIPPQVESEIRKRQFQREMEYISVHAYKWMGYPDGSLLGQAECMDAIDFSPYTKIFLPWGNDNHSDHTATFIYAMEKIKKINRSIEVYQYEVHVPLHDITDYLDITDQIEEKCKLICFHEDQIESVPYDEIVKSLDKYRACQAKNADRYFEAYLKTEVSEDIISNDGIEREMEIQKYRQFYRLIIRWIQMTQLGRRISDYLKERAWNRISIYGYADIGKLLEEELYRAGIPPIEIIDKRKVTSERCKVVEPSDGQRDADAVIVTAVSSYDLIKKELSLDGYENIISLQTLIEKLDGTVTK